MKSVSTLLSMFLLIACGVAVHKPQQAHPAWTRTTATAQVPQQRRIAVEGVDLRPTPTPSPAPAPASVPQMIREAFSPMGQVAVTWGLRVANCESGYNPQAVNPSGDATGVFQFLRSTWAVTPWGQWGYSRTDAWANVQAAAWLYRVSGPQNWECR